MITLIEEFHTMDNHSYNVIYETEERKFGVVLMVDNDDFPIVKFFDSRKQAISFACSLVRSINENIIEFLC